MKQRKMKRIKITGFQLERIIYIAAIVGLLIFGMKDTEAARALIEAAKSAFSLLIP